MSEDMDRRINLPWWRKTPAKVAAAVLAITAAAVLTGAAVMANAKPTLRVDEAKITIDSVEEGLFHDFTPLRATVTPKDQILLDLQEGGQVEAILVRSGDVVAAGQPLVRFSNEVLELQVLERQRSLIDTIANLQRSAKDLEDARVAHERTTEDIAFNIARLTRDIERYQPLADRGFTSKAQVDGLKDQLAHYRRSQALQTETSRRQDELRARELPRIAAQVESLNQSLQSNRAKLDDLTFKAPAAGRLSEMKLQQGQIVTAGFRLGLLTPDTGFKLNALVDEYYLRRVQPGQSAKLTRDGRTLSARVVRVDAQVKDGQFAVELDFEGASPSDLLPGQTLEGKLSLGGDGRALVVPAGAFLEHTGGDWIMVLDRGGRTAERRRIKLGRRNTEQVEVLSGLTAGERVITSNYGMFDKIERVELSK